MNTANIKSYAPKARQAFIVAVTERANKFGIYADHIEQATVTGNLLQIGGHTFEASLAQGRKRLVERVQQLDFAQLMEQVAYSWFNRLCAIRFMELQEGYLGHGLRVLSHPEKSGSFEVLDHAQDAAAELGLDRDCIVELKLAGNKDEELYRELLLGQCHQLYKAMPFLFEQVDDETELLLPENLTRTDSLIHSLVEDIPESDWEQIEIIGWLYQFYISEKKDQVIGKVVKSEDIPAATQLFTPNWIVKYMVQNSLGAQWLTTYPESPLKGQMEYYIEPAEQTDAVNAQLAAITPSSLEPEALTLIDPACGSGHILVEAYDLFKDIYLERGYRQRDIPQLILEKNLFGLDIDDRAAQLTGFALVMKGRADDRRLFDRGIKLNVMALVDSTGLDVNTLAQGLPLGEFGVQPRDLSELKQLFEHATTFGSLIQVPEALAGKLSALMKLSEANSADLFVVDALHQLQPLVQQAELLAAQYDTVVANPPYMGGKQLNRSIKLFAEVNYPDTKVDLYACFISRGLTLAGPFGFSALVTMHSWMFLSTFEDMRGRIVRDSTITTLAHLGARAFGSISGEVVQTAAFVLQNHAIQGFKPSFFRLLSGGEVEKRTALTKGENRFDAVSLDEFNRISGSPLAYWIGSATRTALSDFPLLGEVASPTGGMTTGNNERFLRLWSEVDLKATGFEIADAEAAQESGCKWFPYNKGGTFRRWYGNRSHIVNWHNDGSDILSSGRAYPRSRSHYFQPSITYSATSSLGFGARHCGPGFLFDAKGSSCFIEGEGHWALLALLATKQVDFFLGCLNPTLEFQTGDLRRLPVAPRVLTDIRVINCAKRATELSKSDWNLYERSWSFQSFLLLTAPTELTATLESSYSAWTNQNRNTIAEMKRLEEENNRLFIDAYGLQDELTPEVPIEQITLTVNPAYRYGIKSSEAEREARFQSDTMVELISYAIGCMMGRYSLDEPGLIYANSGNEGFDSSRYHTFTADEDGIVPLTDQEWFKDDATNRLREFIRVAWPEESLQQNLDFIAESLCRNAIKSKKSESSLETIRRYLSTQFYKDHLQTYKKRPIYWLFSSGKQKAFECLVYLHRYNESTLSRMRTEYVTPLLGKYDAFSEQLSEQVINASSTAESNRLKKELTALEKKQNELRAFDDKLKHYADMRISIDLDDGVKENYGKFGDLLADVKAIHGKAPVSH